MIYLIYQSCSFVNTENKCCCNEVVLRLYLCRLISSIRYKYKIIFDKVCANVFIQKPYTINLYLVTTKFMVFLEQVVFYLSLF